MKKNLKITAFVLSVVLFLSALFIYSRKPDYQKQLQLPGLQKTVHVRWNQGGVPKIKAEKLSDAYYALGYLMAQERLFQMDMFRRAAAGKLSEMVGEKALSVDTIARLLEFKKEFQNRYEQNQLDPEVISLVKSYFNGVNEYVNSGVVPLEYIVLGSTPEPFELSDAYAIIGLMSYQFSPAPKRDLIFTKLQKKFSTWQWREFRFFDNQSGMANRVKPLPAGTSEQFFRKKQVAENQFRMEDLIYFEGSNGWVVSAQKSKSGFPILANDPHVGFSLPGIWFEAQLQVGGYEIYGYFLPLVPFPVLGNNRHHGWGVTLSYVDDMDFFQEVVDWQSGRYLEKPGQWEKIQFFNEKINVKGKAPVAIEYGKTKRGVLIHQYENIADLGDLKNTSLHWVWDLPENDPLKGLMQMSFASTKNEFYSALKYVKAPGLNVLYASKDDKKIAKWVVGAVPKRFGNLDGSLVLNAQNPAHLVREILPFEQSNFAIENPPEGYIVSANDRSQNYPYWLQGYWQPQDRFENILASLQQRDQWDTEMMKSVQTQISSSTAKQMAFKLVSALSPDQLQHSAVEKLKSWQGQYDRESCAALIFTKWTQKLNQLIFRPYLNEDDFARYTFLAHSWSFLKKLVLSQLSDQWFDNPTTEQNESRQQIIEQAFAQTIAELQDKYGADTNNWKYSHEHTLSFRHAFANIPVIGALMQKGPYAVDGGFNIIANFRRLGDQDGLEVKAGPSTRRLIDFSSPEKFETILPVGNSGNILSPFFSDQMPLFLKGEYRTEELEFAKNVRFEQTLYPADK